MDYKEKYEQALMVAKETYDKQPMYREWLEKMFPELAESEDEKVRKEIISYLKTRKGYTEAIKDHWIAWLENIPYTIDHEKREGFYLGYKACHEKQGEQKPTDEDMKALLRTEYEKGRADAIAEMQMEWSEEDINMIDRLIRCCEEEHEKLCNDKYGHQDIVSDLKRDCREKWNWLESLKNKVAPQNRWMPSYMGVEETKGGVDMNKKELARQYADNKTIDCYNSRFGLSNHDLHVKKSYDLFTGYDIEQAYEDGFDKAVEFTCEFFYEQLNNGTMECGNIEEFIENYKKKMEG